MDAAVTGSLVGRAASDVGDDVNVKNEQQVRAVITPIIEESCVSGTTMPASLGIAVPNWGENYQFLSNNKCLIVNSRRKTRSKGLL